LSHVINLSLPDTEAGYTHRSGRTGRAGNKGVSISIVTAGEARRLKFLQATVGQKFQHKQVPSQEDILRKQVDGWLAEVEGLDVTDFGDEAYFGEVADRLGSLSRAELIRRFAAFRFSRLRSAKADLNEKPQDFTVRGGGDEVGLSLNFGKRDGLNIKEFFGLINSCPRLKGLDIGRIDLGSNESTFTIGSQFASEAVNSLSTKNFRGRRIVITAGDVDMPQSGRGQKTRGFSRGKSGHGGGKSYAGKSGGYGKPGAKRSYGKSSGSKSAFSRKKK
jgi:ATP-dependent RNA helicase DeaD